MQMRLFGGTWLWWVHLVLGAHLALATAQCGSSASQDKLALYKVTLRTHWTRARFPRHYPEWRPPAQFGKLIGRTHDSAYTLYRLGERLSPGAKQYVESGRADGLDIRGDLPNTLHSFTGAQVSQGEGTSTAKAFLDGNHTLISIMARINPSPDWYVGVDSFQLCVEGNWVDTVTVELDPLDGGTDNGFTFTAANWPTQPQGVAYRITSRYPAHPAGSFYYPNLPRLPPLATLTFTKLREYTLTERYREDDVQLEFITNENLLAARGVDRNHDLNEAIAEERKEMDKRYRYWTTTNGNQPSEFFPLDNKAAIMNSVASSYSRPRTSTPTPTPTPYRTVSEYAPQWRDNDKSKKTKGYRKNADIQRAQIYREIQRKIAAGNQTGNADANPNATSTGGGSSNSTVTPAPADAKRFYNFRLKHHHRLAKGKRVKVRAPRDCKVGEWGPWSACTRSCGIGETQRTRKITTKPRSGGEPCPPLRETKWCGSASPCSDYTKPTSIDIYQW